MKKNTPQEINQNCCGGFCSRCMIHHSLPRGRAEEKALLLRCTLEQKKTIDIFSNCPTFDKELSTNMLFGEERGKMFGVLECCNEDKETVWLYAFSGQYQGRWSVPGWAPPLFDPDQFDWLNIPAEKEIKNLGRNIEAAPDDTTRQELRSRRKKLCRELMIRIHGLYRVANFRGRSTGLDQAFLHPGGKPTGTGDCCAPKLLNFAARSGLAPVSIAELYFGRSNRSGTREHGHIYPPCEDKCRPLLGYMLCGAEERKCDFETED